MPIPSLYSSAFQFAGSAAVAAAADPSHHKDSLTSPQDSELHQKEKIRDEQEKLQELEQQAKEAADKGGFFGDIGNFFGFDDPGAGSPADDTPINQGSDLRLAEPADSSPNAWDPLH